MNDKKAIRIHRKTRHRLREYADERDLTYSEALLELLPEEGEPLERGRSETIRIDTPTYERLDELTGEGADYGDTIAYHLNRANLRRFDMNHDYTEDGDE